MSRRVAILAAAVLLGGCAADLAELAGACRWNADPAPGEVNPPPGSCTRVRVTGAGFRLAVDGPGASSACDAPPAGSAQCLIVAPETRYRVWYRLDEGGGSLNVSTLTSPLDTAGACPLGCE